MSRYKEGATPEYVTEFEKRVLLEQIEVFDFLPPKERLK
jgi:hypothetical protein